VSARHKVTRSSESEAKPGHFIMTSAGWVQIKRGGKHVAWEPKRK
jgi:hypothetical protein